MKYQILQGDNRETLRTLADNSIDAIVTDPPYGIGFLGKDWDSKRASETTSRMAAVQNLPSGMKHTSLADDLEFQFWMRDLWIECYRVLKPGGHVLAFSAARTYHHMAMSLQTAGFEIRDQIMWIYASGFPKSQDVGKSIQRSTKTEDTNEWLGWGTALKPAHEPIALARKPLGKGLSIAKNADQWGTGALNIDATRVPYDGDKPKPATFKNGVSYRQHTEELYQKQVDHTTERTQEYNETGRFPSNVLGDIPDYQKYFYCPKVSRKERHMGFNLTVKVKSNLDMVAEMGGHFIDKHGNPLAQGNNMLWLPHTGNIYVHGLTEVYRKWCIANNINPGNVGNNHPTVKPVALMEYLIKLITPQGGTVLDPFNGSGSTGMAATGLGYNYIGCELDPAYVDISLKRIAAWNEPEQPVINNNFETLFSAADVAEFYQEELEEAAE